MCVCVCVCMRGCLCGYCVYLEDERWWMSDLRVVCRIEGEGEELTVASGDSHTRSTHCDSSPTLCRACI